MWVDAILACVIFTMLIVWYFEHVMLQEERKHWQQERRDLMDRIQAPTFAEYSNKVVREKKAEQPQEEEKPIEFVS